jgi:HKD family nuclease
MSHLVLNIGNVSHRARIESAMINADSIRIAVGFLGSSGLEHLRTALEKSVERGAIVNTYVGLSLHWTEPNALRELLAICSKRAGNKVFLCDPPGLTFHPKIYCCQHATKTVLIVGSANTTAGGMVKNVEGSLEVSVNPDSDLLKEVMAFFRHLESEPWVQPANEIRISKYERRYEITHRSRRRAEKEADEELSGLRDFDLDIMWPQIKEYMADEDEQIDLEQKVRNYREARNVLEEMVEAKYRNSAEFLVTYELLVGAAGSGRLWHSAGLYRGKEKVATGYHRFVRMLREIRDNIGVPPDDLFSLARKYIDVKSIEKIRGLGVNVITEVFNTYAPEKYPVLNNNPLGVLRFFGFSDFPTSNAFRPETYVVYTSLMAEIATEFGFADLSRVDHFMNYIYWKEHDKIKGRENKR